MSGGGLVDEVHLSSERRFAFSGAEETNGGPAVSTVHRCAGRRIRIAYPSLRMLKIACFIRDSSLSMTSVD